MKLSFLRIKGKNASSASRSDRAEAYEKERFSLVAELQPGAVEDYWRLRKGTNSFLYRGRVSGWGEVIFRFYPPQAGKAKGRSHAWMSDYLKKLNIQTPQLIITDFSRETARRYDFHVVVEEFIHGDELSPPCLDENKWLKRFLAFLERLHTHTDERSGVPWVRQNERETPEKYFRKRVPVYIKRMSKCLGPYSKESRRILRQWFDQRMARCDFSGPYELICGDVKPDNFVIVPDQDQLFCVDLGNFIFGFFEEDLVQIEDNFFDRPETTASREAFFQAYFDRFEDGEARAASYARNREFFVAFRALEKAASAGVKLDKIKSGRKNKDTRSVHRENADWHLRQLAAITGMDEFAPAPEAHPRPSTTADNTEEAAS